MSKLFAELKRRKIFKVAAVYAVVSWLVIQVATAITPALQLPLWTPSLVVVLLLLGFIPTLIAAWAYELTPDGLRPDAQVAPVAGLQATAAQPINYVILVVVLLVAGVQLAERFSSEQPAPANAGANSTALASGTQRLSVVLPARQSIANIGANPTNQLALSPDGRTLIYVARNRDLPAGDAGIQRQLFQRTLNTLNVSALPETLGAAQPFFSPDGQSVAFFTHTGELKKIALGGGVPVTLVEGLPGGAWSFGVWTDEDDIVYSDLNYLHSIPAGGGTPRQLTSLNETIQELNHWFPSMVPGKRAVLFTVISEPPTARRIEVLLLDSGERRVVLDNASGAHVLPSGHVLFQRATTVMLAPFDVDTLTVTGLAVPVPDAIGMDNSTQPYPQAQLTVAGNGSLAYLPEEILPRELGTLVPGDSFQPLGLSGDNYSQPRVAPDGRTLSFILQRDGQRGLFSYDLTRRTTTRLSPESAAIASAAWRPDGSGLALATEGGAISLLQNGQQTLLVPSEPGYDKHSMRWTPDGRQFVYTRQQGQTHDLWVHDMDGAQPDRPIVATATQNRGPALSPDGRWLAFTSDESGRNEIYVQAWPEGPRYTVSRDGGRSALWSTDGSALFFVGMHDDVGKMLQVTVTAGQNGLQLGMPEPLFDMRQIAPDGAAYLYVPGNNITGAGFDILPDGRFVLLREAEPVNREVVIVQNWFDEVRRLAPGAVRAQ
ncbi:MAG: hypothetical protein Q8L60_11480 [Gammaproteobacteria bacterium]|nr:hypothetical protein [Gammaproteobacteria bacterium]MDP2347093.1 hypothetical protein [Gammaproteobacteria bacterium]